MVLPLGLTVCQKEGKGERVQNREDRDGEH